MDRRRRGHDAHPQHRLPLHPVPGLGLDLVVDEIRRIWALSDVYRSASLMDPRGRPRMFEEHAEMIAALRRDDPEAVVALMGIHRDGTRTSIAGLLAVGSGGSRTA
ncbi:FCD domain-containing protein [Peterkaempfera bronchialis]|uniref:FCD domain-containing protein n=1 Tax=Peterkaempfera bronchialis TaxID=2126346 RepID=A0A345T729_9ACTN|nr:FCD domain-containing protein [Peterkaempfera bronchialis]